LKQKKTPFFHEFHRGFQEAAVKTALWVLGRALQSASKTDPDIRKEISVWPEGFSVVMNVLPSGPEMVVWKHAGALQYRGSRLSDADLILSFKNLSSGFLVLTPQKGPAQAFAERRMIVKGDLGDAMIFTRCLNQMLAYLYPAWVCGYLLKRVPPMPFSKQLIRIKIFTLGILFGR